MSPLAMLPVEWPAPARVRAVCTLRDGGFSLAPYGSLNLAANVGDDPQAVAANRAKLRAELGLPHEPLWLRQVHGTHVFDADQRVNEEADTPPEADAAVT